MCLIEQSRLTEADVSCVVGLGQDMGAELESLYAQAYGDTVEGDQVFDHSILPTGQYFDIWEGDKLVSAAGVHVFSPGGDAAVLGNIATLPDFRGLGLGDCNDSATLQIAFGARPAPGPERQGQQHPSHSLLPEVGL